MQQLERACRSDDLNLVFEALEPSPQRLGPNEGTGSLTLQFDSSTVLIDLVTFSYRMRLPNENLLRIETVFYGQRIPTKMWKQRG